MEKIIWPGPGKNLARPEIRARAGLRAENRRAKNCRSEKPGRPGPVPIPAV